MRDRVEYTLDGARHEARLGACLVRAYKTTSPESFVQVTPSLNNDGLYGIVVNIIIGNDRGSVYLTESTKRVAAVIFSTMRTIDPYFDHWRQMPPPIVVNPVRHQALTNSLALAIAGDFRAAWDTKNANANSDAAAKIKW